MSCISSTAARALATLTLVATLAWPTLAPAAPLPVLPGYGGPGVGTAYPGDTFDWPAPVSGYSWLVDVSGVTSAPTTAVDFVVTNVMSHPLPVQTFQVFGNCDGSNPVWMPGFSLFIDEVQTPWSAVSTDLCGYHDFVDFWLSPGDTRFRVVLDDAPDASALYIDARFGNVMAAVPLPAAGFALLGGLAALAAIRRRRSAV